jgi:flagellin
MALSINSNVASLNAQRNLGKTQGSLSTAMERLSSGLRINSAKDDAAGLSISNRMTSQIRGLNQASRNANDGISLAQTAEGALSETTNILQRVRELAVQSANATNSSGDRDSLQSEVNQLVSELDRISDTTSFNGIKLLDGSFAQESFQIGADANQTISVSVKGAASSDLGVNKLGTSDTVKANINGVSSAEGANQTTSDGILMTTAATGTALGTNAGEANNQAAAQTLTITNPDATTATYSVTAGADMKTVADALDDKTGVTATATTTAEISNIVSGGNITMNVQGTEVTFDASVDSNTAATNLKTAIEANTTLSENLTVTDDGAGTLTLVDDSGRNISVDSLVDDVETGTILGDADNVASLQVKGAGDTDAKYVSEKGASLAVGAAITIDNTGAAGGEASTITVNGQDVTFATGATPTAAETGVLLTAALNTALGAGSFTDNTDGTITFNGVGGTGTQELLVQGFSADAGTADAGHITVGGDTIDENNALKNVDSGTVGGVLTVNLESGYNIKSSVEGDTTAGGLFDSAAATDITLAQATVGSEGITRGNSVAEQQLTIVGDDSETVDINANSSAKGIVTAVNAESGTTGVTAKAETSATLSNLSTAGTVSFNVYGTNGSSDPVVITGSVVASDLSNLVSDINDKTSQTGLTAEISNSGDALTIKSSTGEDIKIENFRNSSAFDDTTNDGVDNDVTVTMDVAGTTGSTLTLTDDASETSADSAVVGGVVSFQSTSGAFTISSDVAAADGGLFAGASNVDIASDKSTVNQIDISTVDGSTEAIEIVDGALAQVDTNRANLGAIQNRFESTIANLQSVSENLTSARSRILDADIAQETAAMTKNNILQQAGVSILAQANQLPQMALSLLG